MNAHFITRKYTLAIGAMFASIILFAPFVFATNTSILQVNTSYAQTAALPECTAGFTTQPNVGAGDDLTFTYHNPTGEECAPTQAQKNPNDTSGDPNSVCGLRNWDFNLCIAVPLGAWLGSWFLTWGAALLKLSGLLFDHFIGWFVIGFGSTLTSLGIMPFISTGWTIFRDFSNILIIGMFTFIAICTILGIEKYGYKKLIANVLIIAVLMNFSLLFTKLIIDASNFTAYQFYSQMTQSNASTCKDDIACAFLAPIGITSIWNSTGKITADVGKANGAASGFFFGFVGGVLLAMVALVLLYGVVLMFTRGILIIVLMLTSAVAFATYLIPNFTDSEYGWKGWWKALINCAIFAPVLMLFLSISLAILNGIKPLIPTGADAGGLAQIITDPNQLSKGWTVILTYVISVGLLFASLKISSKFASLVSGMNVASAIAGGLGVATGGLAGLAGRQTIGRGSNAIAEGMMRTASRLANREKQTAWTRLGSSALYSGAKPFKATAKADFNIANTKAVQGVVPKSLQGKAAGGFEGRIKARGEAFAKKADELSLKKNNIKPEDLRQEAVDAMIKQQPHLEAERATVAGAVGNAEKKVAEVTSDKSQKAVREEASKASVEVVKIQEEHSKLKKSAEADPTNTEKQNAAESKLVELETAKTKQQQILNDQDNRIKEARQALKQAQSAQNDFNNRVLEMAQTTGAAPINITVDKKTGGVKSAGRDTSTIARDMAHNRFSNTLGRFVGLSTPNTDRVAGAAAKGVDSHHKKEAREAAAVALGLKADAHGEHKDEKPKEQTASSTTSSASNAGPTPHAQPAGGETVHEAPHGPAGGDAHHA
jgi:hypothetical protein